MHAKKQQVLVQKHDRFSTLIFLFLHVIPCELMNARQFMLETLPTISCKKGEMNLFELVDRTMQHEGFILWPDNKGILLLHWQNQTNSKVMSNFRKPIPPFVTRLSLLCHHLVDMTAVWHAMKLKNQLSQKIIYNPNSTEYHHP